MNAEVRSQKAEGKMDPKGLIFDCDGTLADTMPLHWRAWQVVARRYQLHFPEERFYALGGVPSRDILKMLSEEQGRELDPILAAKEKEAEYLPHLLQVQPVEAVVRIARENYGKIPMAVASGGIQSHINDVLQHLGIRHFFQAVVTSEYVKRQKPAPDIFLRRPAASVWNRNSAAPTRTRTLDCRPSSQPGWSRWMCV